MKKFIKNLWEKAEKQGRLQGGRKKNRTILKKTVVIAGKMVYNGKREVALTERRSEKAEDTILFGKYRISRVIGRGRSGTVFLARHLGLDEDRAIKRVPRTGAEIAGEAELLKKLRHPGIPVIYDLESDANYFYLIEEYLDGESLRALVEREGSLTKARRIQFGIELCQIIDYLHSSESNPILYLDLQPGNILICRGTLKLIDFDRAVFASRAGALKAYYGTRGFAAPEQYDGGPLDVRTDIYAIGALLFYMGTGRFPREEDAAEAAGSAEKLTAVTGRCLSRRKEARYQNVSEVLEALKELERGTVLTREERRNDGPLLRVAAAASRSGAGATSLALAAALFLEGLGISCLYREKNGTGAVRKMAAYRNGVPDDYGIFHMRGLALKPEYGPFVKLCEPVFSAVADDYGTGVEAVLEEEYDVICEERLIKDPYILMFGWNTNNDLIEVAKRASEYYKLPVFNIVPPPRGMFKGIRRKLDVGPKEFLSMIKYADFIVSNSFHGTAFSATYEKPFVSVVTGNPDDRMKSMLDQLGLGHRLCTKEEVDFSKIKADDFLNVKHNKNILRSASFDYLSRALGDE